MAQITVSTALKISPVDFSRLTFPDDFLSRSFNRTSPVIQVSSPQRKEQSEKSESFIRSSYSENGKLVWPSLAAGMGSMLASWAASSLIAAKAAAGTTLFAAAKNALVGAGSSVIVYTPLMILLARHQGYSTSEILKTIAPGVFVATLLRFGIQAALLYFFAIPPPASAAAASLLAAAALHTLTPLFMKFAKGGNNPTQSPAASER